MLKGKERCSRGGNDQTLSLLQDSNPLGGGGASDGTLKKIDSFSKAAVMLREPTN